LDKQDCCHNSIKIHSGECLKPAFCVYCICQYYI
jgi:hypothetical protein